MIVNLSPEGETRLRTALRSIRINLAYWDQTHWIDRDPASPKTLYGVIPAVERPTFIVLEPMVDGAGVRIAEGVCNTTMCLAGFIAFAYNKSLASDQEWLVEGAALEALGIDGYDQRLEFSKRVFHYTTATGYSQTQEELIVEGWAKGAGRKEILNDDDAVFELASRWEALRGNDETPEVALENFTMFVGRVSEVTGLDFSDVLEEVVLEEVTS